MCTCLHTSCCARTCVACVKPAPEGFWPDFSEIYFGGGEIWPKSPKGWNFWTRRVETSRGAERRVRFEKINVHPKGENSRTHTHVHGADSAHTCTVRRARITQRKNNRTLRPSGARDRVKIALACARVRAFYACTPSVYTLYVSRTFGAVYEPRSEAESAPRKRKNEATERSEVFTSRGAKRTVRHKKKKEKKKK